MRKLYWRLSLIFLIAAGGIWLLLERRSHEAISIGVSPVRPSGEGDTRVSDPNKDSLLRAQAVLAFRRKWCKGLVCTPLVNVIIQDSGYRMLRGYRSMELTVIRAEYSIVIVSNDFSMVGPEGKIGRHSVLAVMDTSGRLVQWLRKM